MGTHVTDHPVVGSVRWKAEIETSGQPIEFLDDFETKIVNVTIPQLQGVIDGRTNNPNAHVHGPIKFYEPAVPQLLAAFAEIESRGLKDRLISFEGSFAKRLIRRQHGGPVHTPSNHAFGTAFDINIGANGQGDIPAAVGVPGSVRELVPIFENFGFIWGAHFPTPDGMHFEVKTLLPAGSFMHPEPVVVVVNNTPSAIPCLLIEDRCWLGARSATAIFGGTIKSAGGNPFKLVITINTADHSLKGQLIGNVGFVKATDLLPLYNATFEYNSAAHELRVSV